MFCCCTTPCHLYVTTGGTGWVCFSADWLARSLQAEVARRLEFVSPSVIRASVVLFSVTYSYSVVAYALFCATPMGQQPIDTVKDDSMVQR